MVTRSVGRSSRSFPFIPVSCLDKEHLTVSLLRMGDGGVAEEVLDKGCLALTVFAM